MVNGIKTPNWVNANLKDHPKLRDENSKAYTSLKRSVPPSNLIRSYLDMCFDEEGVEYFKDINVNVLREDFWALFYDMFRR